MKRIIITILLITMVAAVAIAAPRNPPPPPQQAQGPGHGPGGPGELPPGLLAEFLGLTDAQMAQIDTLRETMRAAVEPLHATQQSNREQIKAAVEAGDAAKAGALMVANYQVGQQIKAARDAFKAGVENLLTAEQKAKFAVYQELVELRRERGPREPRD